MISHDAVHETIRKFTIGDGLPIVVDLQKSQGSYIHDSITNEKYMDCYSQFASQPIGWNHPKMVPYMQDIYNACGVKIANSDMYTQEYATFVSEFAEITPDFQHYYFVDGGTLGVENALKCAMDWKAQKSGLKDNNDFDYVDIVHLREAFHGRSGYSMSLTNTVPNKTKWYPKFQWSRILNPKIHFPDCKCVESLEEVSLEQAEKAMQQKMVAAIILETIQGEGGDNHFRPEYLQSLRKLADKYEALFIVDEVQTGVGLTGKMWAYEHFGIVPDMICFGKKTQVCGFCCTNKVDDVNNVFKASSRINSTWGGNIVDMMRFVAYKKIIIEDNLVERTRQVGEFFISRLASLQDKGLISNVRGRGLMLAFDLENTERRDEIHHKLFENRILTLKSGHKSIRLRPHLTFEVDEADRAVFSIENALTNV